MAVTFKWEITEIVAVPPDYAPKELNYRLTGTDGTNIQMVQSGFGIAHLADGRAFEDITEEMALDWLFNDLLTPQGKADQEAMVERHLQAQIVRKARMSQKPAVPWDTTFKAGA